MIYKRKIISPKLPLSRLLRLGICKLSVELNKLESLPMASWSSRKATSTLSASSLSSSLSSCSLSSSSSSTFSSSLSSSSYYRQKYEVFLTFCGKDYWHNFTNLVYDTLIRMGISVFKSDGIPEPGEKIHQRLKDAIEECQYAVVVISNNFGATRSCLLELDVIMKRREMGCLTVFPIFCRVNPFVVRQQAGYFGEAFARLKDDPKVRTKKWENWKAILTKIGDCSLDSSEVVEDPLKSFGIAREEGGKLCGWHVKDRYNMENFRKIINKISWKIFGELIPKSIDSAKFLVGIESQAMRIMELLHLEEPLGVQFIGICGMRGIGKTTLAKVIYDRVHNAFEAWSFISDIGKTENKGLVGLQRKLLLDLKVKVVDSLDGHALIRILKRLLKNKKVLIVLDDVRQRKQIEALVGSAEWFDKGSRIILTSTNHYLPLYFCKDNGYENIYEVKELNDNAALQLFCLKAFNKLEPKEEFKRLTKDIVDFTQGLPLALEDFGSKLYDLEKSRWECYLIQLKANLNGAIVKKLRIDFDELGDLAQKVFLDIVCFFKGQSKSYVMYALECLGYPSKSIIEELEHKSLLKFEKNEILVVHNLLTQMGQEIAKQAGFWSTEDIVTILREKETPKPNAIRGILLKFPQQKPERLCYDAFSSMQKLQLLEINTPEGLIWSAFWKGFIKLKWSGNPQEFSLSNELCVLRWDQYPLESLPHGFKPANLVELNLRRSSIKALWGDVKRFHKLKYIDLHCSKELIEIPDLSDIPNLERLDVSNCSKLSKVHFSIGFLERLREMSLRNCFRLRHLPNTFRLPSLTSLDLCGCSRRKKFPGGVRNLKSLRTLNLSNTAIKTLPRSFTRLLSLKDLYISGRYFSEEMTNDDFSGSTKLPDTRFRPSGFLADARSVKICDWSAGLSLLERLDLSYRNLGCEALPSCFAFLSTLTFLNLSGNKFKEIPDSVRQLFKLRHLLLNNCVNLERLPRLPMGLRYLDLGNCPLLERFYEDSNACKSRPCDWMAIYFGNDGESYSFLNLHPGSTVWNNHGGHSVRRVAWGLSRQFEIPDWFYRRRMGRIPFPPYWGYDPLYVEGYALFIIYEVPYPEADLSFDCRLQEDEEGLGVHLRFLAHERSRAGRNGVWMYIPSGGKDLVRLGNESSASVNMPIASGSTRKTSSLALLNPHNMFSASIQITSKTVEVKEIGARVLCEGESAIDSGIYDFDDYFRQRNMPPRFEVHGPVKLPIDPSCKSSGV